LRTILNKWYKSQDIHSAHFNMTEDNKRYHLIINVDEKYAIVNALAFYHAHHTLGSLLDEDEREQYELAFKEDGPTLVDTLATRVANTF
jgi:hypothetical protein